MDRLEEIFERQQAFNEELIRVRGLSGISSEEWIQKYALAMLVEMGELLEEINYKWWKNTKPTDIGAVKEELADILHFFVSMCLKAGMDAEELHRRYMGKNQENFMRQRGLSHKPGYEYPADPPSP